MDKSKPPGLQIGQVLVLSVKFGHREDALAMEASTPIPEIPLQFEAKVGGKPGEKAAAVRLRVWTPPERTDLFYSLDIEIAAVIVATPGEENMDPFEYSRNIGPLMLFPFLREAVANITMKGRFGPLWMKPTNLLVPKQEAPALEASAAQDS